MPDLTGSILFVAKIFAVFAFGLYVAFAGVLVRQVHLMTSTLEVGFESPIRFLAWVHFFAALAILLLAIIFL